MPTFEEFAKQFNLDDPESCRQMLAKYQAYIDAMWDVFGSRWTWCGGCHKTVRFDLVTTADEPVGDKIKSVTRCPECGSPWFIREKE